MAYNALYLAGMGWNSPNLIGNPGAMEPDFYQKSVNESMFGFYGYWWPLFLDYNEAVAADDPSVRQTVRKEAVALVFREYSYSKGRPGLNGETSGLVKFYMPMSKAIEHVLSPASETHRFCSTIGWMGEAMFGCVAPGDDNWPDACNGQPIIPEEIHLYPCTHMFFKPDGNPWTRPLAQMLDYVPPLPGIDPHYPEGFGQTLIQEIVDSTGGEFRPQFRIGEDPGKLPAKMPTGDAGPGGLKGHLYDPNYNYTFLKQDTQFAKRWPVWFPKVNDKPGVGEIYEALIQSDDETGEVSFLGWGNNVLGNPWSNLPYPGPWHFLEDDLNFENPDITRADWPIGPLDDKLFAIAQKVNLWGDWSDQLPIQENYAEWLAERMHQFMGRPYWQVPAPPVEDDPGPPLPQELREQAMSFIKTVPVADYIIEGDTIYDWMQWASAMAGGWPKIGERHRRNRIGLRAHLERGDIGPDTVVQWRGKLWRPAGDDEETRMDSVRWITSPPTDVAPGVLAGGKQLQIHEESKDPALDMWTTPLHIGRLATGVGWETYKRWRRLIPPPEVNRETSEWSSRDMERGQDVGFGHSSIDYGVLLASDLKPCRPAECEVWLKEPILHLWNDGYVGFRGYNGQIFDGYIRQDDIDRIGGPIPEEYRMVIKPGRTNREFVRSNDRWTLDNQINYANFLENQNPGIFFEKFGRLPVWEEIPIPRESHYREYLKHWPEIPLEVVDKNDPEEQWKIDQMQRSKRQIVIPPLFTKYGEMTAPWTNPGPLNGMRTTKRYWTYYTETPNGNTEAFDQLLLLNWGKSIRPELPPGPTNGYEWNYLEPGGNVAGIRWGKPRLREIVATSFTQNEQGAPAGASGNARNFPPWEGTPVWYLALTSYSQDWSVLFPPDKPWVANPPLWLMPAPPSYANELMSEQWPDPIVFGGPGAIGPGDLDAIRGIPGATASQEFLALLQQNTRFLARQVGFRGLRGVFSPD